MLSSLSVKNFRNLNIDKLDFKQGVVVIVGDNGQGKTNLLEAIYFLSYGKSFRGPKAQIIKWKHETANIIGEAGRDKIELRINRDEKNIALVNSKQKRHSALIGRFVSVIFHPEEIEVISGSPNLRRAWLDKLISTIDKNYLFNLVNYQKALHNKNRLLKTVSASKEQLEVWNETLAKLGSKIWRRREEVAKEISQILKNESSTLIGKKLIFNYSNPLVGKTKIEAERVFLKLLEAQREVEERIQVTVFGPHRDDFKIIKEETSDKTILQKELAEYGSRAEQRQAVLLLKIVEAKVFKDYFKEAPSILLDDAASELDKKNRELFLSRLWARQIFITTTSLETLPEEVRKKSQKLRMEKGTPVPI